MNNASIYVAHAIQRIRCTLCKAYLSLIIHLIGTQQVCQDARIAIVHHSPLSAPCSLFFWNTQVSHSQSIIKGCTKDAAKHRHTSENDIDTYQISGCQEHSSISSTELNDRRLLDNNAAANMSPIGTSLAASCHPIIIIIV